MLALGCTEDCWRLAFLTDCSGGPPGPWVSGVLHVRLVRRRGLPPARCRPEWSLRVAHPTMAAHPKFCCSHRGGVRDVARGELQRRKRRGRRSVGQRPQRRRSGEGSDTAKRVPAGLLADGGHARPGAALAGAEDGGIGSRRTIPGSGVCGVVGMAQHIVF